MQPYLMIFWVLCNYINTIIWQLHYLCSLKGVTNTTNSVLIGAAMGGIVVVSTAVILVYIMKRRDYNRRQKARRDAMRNYNLNSSDLVEPDRPMRTRNQTFNLVELDRPMSTRNQTTRSAISSRTLGPSDPPRNSYRLSLGEPIAQPDADLPPSYEEATKDWNWKTECTVFLTLLSMRSISGL